MTFSQALANALEPATLQQALWRYLPAFAGEREFWMLTRRPDRWETFLQDATATRTRPLEELEAIADRALSPDTLADARLTGIVEGDVLCFPMVAAGAAVGVLGIHDGAAITGDQRKALGAATGLIAIAVRNVQLFLETREHSLRDSLTNCFNRGHGLETLDGELRRARRSRQPLSILMFDIDRFKTINDELGHLRGDDLLRAVGAQLTRVLRSTDVRCRYGGDEFLIILPDTPLDRRAAGRRVGAAGDGDAGDGRRRQDHRGHGERRRRRGRARRRLGVTGVDRAGGQCAVSGQAGGRDRCSVDGAAEAPVPESELEAIGPPAAAIREP